MTRLYYKPVPGFDTVYETTVFFGQQRIEYHTVVGFGVGLFAVRCLPDDTTVSGGQGNEGLHIGRKNWVVDFLPARMGIVNLSRLDDALVVADELSRYTPPEMEHATSWSEVQRLLDPKLFKWVQAIAKDRHVAGGFRAFRDGQDPYLSLVAADLGLPYAEIYAMRDWPDIRARRLEVKRRCFTESAGLARD